MTRGKETDDARETALVEYTNTNKLLTHVADLSTKQHSTPREIPKSKDSFILYYRFKDDAMSVECRWTRQEAAQLSTR